MQPWRSALRSHGYIFGRTEGPAEAHGVSNVMDIRSSTNADVIKEIFIRRRPITFDKAVGPRGDEVSCCARRCGLHNDHDDVWSRG